MGTIITDGANYPSLPIFTPMNPLTASFWISKSIIFNIPQSTVRKEKPFGSA